MVTFEEAQAYLEAYYAQCEGVQVLDIVDQGKLSPTLRAVEVIVVELGHRYSTEWHIWRELAMGNAVYGEC